MPPGGVDWPKSYGPPTAPGPPAPQQTIVPSVFTPQVCQPPVLTEAKVPDGGVHWPEVLSPQQTTLPSVFMPQLSRAPTLMEVKVPDGGVHWP